MVRSVYRVLLIGFAGLIGSVAAIAQEAQEVQEVQEVKSAGFDAVYSLLETHCGACHVQGVADRPWSLDTPPGPDRFPICLIDAEDARLRCATYHEFVDSPGDGIPAWIRPDEAARSEPYVEACDAAVSFHIGHSLPAPLPEADCDRFLRWIESGARR